MLAVAAAIVVVIAGWLMTSGDDTVEMVPADQPPSSAQSPSIGSESTSVTFVSPRNGFSIKYPNRGEGTVTPATQLWGFSQQVDDSFDVIDTGLDAVVKVASVDEYLSNDTFFPDGCGVPRSRQDEITIDGQSGRIAECPNGIEATVVAGGRLYVFILMHDRSDARAVFDALIATVDLTPETAVEFPAMATTFVSPTYGYSFKYHDRGGLQTATEIWDAGNQAPIEIFGWDPRFDGVETGLAAYFEAASTPIPDGVSIDEWVDTSITPRSAGGCGTPRSEQEEIVVDGQPGRKAECDHSEATVVVGGRVYLFIGPNDDRHWFDGWITTIELTPETAAVS
jgi:hypothetical protein